MNFDTAHLVAKTAWAFAALLLLLHMWNGYIALQNPVTQPVSHCSDVIVVGSADCYSVKP
jgi:hypothetical protein